jgi:hypothetical protein
MGRFLAGGVFSVLCFLLLLREAAGVQQDAEVPGFLIDEESSGVGAEEESCQGSAEEKGSGHATLPAASARTAQAFSMSSSASRKSAILSISEVMGEIPFSIDG